MFLNTGTNVPHNLIDGFHSRTNNRKMMQNDSKVSDVFSNIFDRRMKQYVFDGVSSSQIFEQSDRSK